MKSRRLVFWSTALLLVIFAHTGVWVIACLRLQDGYRESLVSAKEAGIDTSSTSLHWSGWPFAAEVIVDEVGIRGPATLFPPDLDWTADRLRVRLSARHPTSLQLLPEGHQTIAMAGLPKVPFEAATLRIVIDLTGHDPVWAMLQDLDASPPAGRAHMTAGILQLPTNAVVASLSGITLPGIAAPIGMVQGRVSIEPAFPPAASAAASAQAWRAAGGRLSVTDAQLHWDSLDASLTASGGLDAALQPEGSGELTVTGLADFLDRLVAIGAIPASSAIAAKAVLALLAAPSGGGKLPLPVALRAGVVSVARFPLLRLAPLAWN